MQTIQTLHEIPVTFCAKTQSQKRQARRAAANYLEHCAIVSAPDPLGLELPPQLLPECGSGAVHGVCVEGHHWGKVVLCGREWCSVCGKTGSEAHNRKWSRAWEKVSKMECLGYFVVTLPEEIRPRFETPHALSLLGLALRQVLENHGFPRGLSRWHFFGDEGEYFHPHFNALVDGRYIKPEELAAIKADWATVLGLDSGSDFVCHYSYRQGTAKVLHTLKYVFHPTFTTDRLAGYEDLARSLIGFRNTKYWGGPKAWAGEAKHSLEGDEETGETLDLIKSICPDCGSVIKWGEIVSARDWAGQPVGEAGYLRLRKRRDILMRAADLGEEPSRKDCEEKPFEECEHGEGREKRGGFSAGIQKSFAL